MNNILSHIVEKKTVQPLLIKIQSNRVPLWFVDVIKLLATYYPQSKIVIAIYPAPANQRKDTWVYFPIIMIEKLLFRQKLEYFDLYDIENAFINHDNVEISKGSPDTSQSKYTCLSFLNKNSEAADDADYNYPQQILEGGTIGVIMFLKAFLLDNQPIEVATNGMIVWQHYFQTLEYSIDKNTGFFKAALKQSFENIWRSSREQKYVAIKANKVGVWSLYQGWIKTVLTRAFKYFKKLLYYKRWSVLVQSKNADVKKIIPKGKDGWADPFLVGDSHLFVEQIDASTNKGELALVLLDDKSQVKSYSTVINEPFHLSYPNVFHLDNSWCMIPESAADMSLRLYQSNEFPIGWKLKRKLQSQIRFLDFTPFYHNGLWWLFTVSKVLSDGGSYDQLYLFYSEDFLNKSWEAHKQNPIITNSSSARMAGNLFWQDGELFRPSQDCFHCYGGQIKINKVLALNRSEYKEELVEIINPQKIGFNAHAVHTFNKGKELTVYDIQSWELKIK